MTKLPPRKFVTLIWATKPSDGNHETEYWDIESDQSVIDLLVAICTTNDAETEIMSQLRADPKVIRLWSLIKPINKVLGYDKG